MIHEEKISDLFIHESFIANMLSKNLLIALSKCFFCQEQREFLWLRRLSGIHLCTCSCAAFSRLAILRCKHNSIWGHFKSCDEADGDLALVTLVVLLTCSHSLIHYTARVSLLWFVETVITDKDDQNVIRTARCTDKICAWW